MEITDEDGSTMTIQSHPGIDIETDARHGWRKNAKDTTVVALGQKTHKVLCHEHVTKHDDAVTQRHELIGTQRIYRHLEKEGVSVNVHAHDRNMTINKFVKDNYIINQNDTWHGVKSARVGKNH